MGNHHHASYSALTDYEAGLARRIGMETHLALDLRGALTLCGAGLLLRGHPTRERGLLFGLGLAELAVIALSDDRVGQQHPMMAYPPLDVPKPVTDELWIVDSVIGPGAAGPHDGRVFAR